MVLCIHTFLAMCIKKVFSCNIFFIFFLSFHKNILLEHILIPNIEINRKSGSKLWNSAVHQSFQGHLEISSSLLAQIFISLQNYLLLLTVSGEYPPPTQQGQIILPWQNPLSHQIILQKNINI